MKENNSYTAANSLVIEQTACVVYLPVFLHNISNYRRELHSDQLFPKQHYEASSNARS